MGRNNPTVSIGLPVFNGENYLEEELDSILSQTYQDFELIISDNASTDKTQQICQAYATKDDRIRYYRNKINLGASKNFNRVFELSRGKYFMWAGHDDVHTPDFLSRCVSILDNYSSIILCYSKTGRINNHGKLIGNYGLIGRFDSQKPNERFGDLINMRYPNWIMIYGLIRSNSLINTQLFGDYIGVDIILLAEIALLGRMYEISDYLFFRREHPQAYTNKGFDSYQEKLDWWVKTKSTARFSFPYWKICLEYFKSVNKIPLKWSERLLCYKQIFRWLLREGWLFMFTDVALNVLANPRYKKPLGPIYKWLIQQRDID